MNHVFVNNLPRPALKPQHTFILCSQSALRLETESAIKVRVCLLTSGCHAYYLQRLIMGGEK